MKQTAVEWLVEKISYSTSEGTIIFHHFIINKLVEQAKEMEKKEKEKEYLRGYNDAKQLDNLLDDLQNH